MAPTLTPATNMAEWPNSRLLDFLSLVAITDNDDDCWVWHGSVNLPGYGQYGGNAKGAHRISYELAIGPIEKGSHIHHKCRNKLCVNPKHLTPLTLAEHGRLHSRDGKFGPRRKKTVCAQGHALTEDNVGTRTTGKRWCKTCNAQQCEAKYRKTHPVPEPKVSCQRGHAFDEENTYYHAGHRACKICRMESVKRYQQTAKGRAAKKLVKSRAKAKYLTSAPECATISMMETA